MKQKLFLIMLAIIMLLPIAFQASANTNIIVYLNNEEIIFDVEPVIVDDRTMVPMRAIAEKLGATVTWDDNTKTAHAYNYDESKGVSVTVGSSYMTDIYNKVITLDAPAIVNNGRTLVPLRAVAEAFKCEVHWDGQTRTVKIYSEDFVDYSKASDNMETVEAATAEELLYSIGSNKRIILTADYYNLSEVSEVNSESVKKQNGWGDKFLDAYIVKNVVNMTIEGSAEIVVDDKDADVIKFENCGKITLSGLTIGHTTSYEQYMCEGAVLRFENCDNIMINNCSLYGCGAFGIFAENVSALNVCETKIYDCTYTGIWLTNGSKATVDKTEFFDSSFASGFIRVDSSSINCTNCSVHDVECKGVGDFIEIENIYPGKEPSDVIFSGCSFTNNTFDELTNSETGKITFNNCIFKNNKGNIKHLSATHNNSTIS